MRVSADGGWVGGVEAAGAWVASWWLLLLVALQRLDITSELMCWEKPSSQCFVEQGWLVMLNVGDAEVHLWLSRITDSPWGGC